jgi:hypothetical protein
VSCSARTSLAASDSLHVGLVQVLLVNGANYQSGLENHAVHVLPPPPHASIPTGCPPTQLRRSKQQSGVTAKGRTQHKKDKPGVASAHPQSDMQWTQKPCTCIVPGAGGTRGQRAAAKAFNHPSLLLTTLLSSGKN